MSSETAHLALDLALAALLTTAAATVLHRWARSPERAGARALWAAGWGAAFALAVAAARPFTAAQPAVSITVPAVALVAASIVVLVTLRGLRAPGEAAWLGLMIGAGHGAVAAVFGGAGAATVQVASGAAAAGLVAWAIVEPRVPQRSGWLAAATVAAGGIELGAEALRLTSRPDWSVWAAAAGATALALAGTRGFERRLLKEQLEREAGLGTLPAELVPALMRLPAPTGWACGLRRDEREALLRTVIRLAVAGWALLRVQADRVPVVGLEVGRLRLRLRQALARTEKADESDDG